MNCCVLVSTENLKHLGQNTLFLQLVTQVLTKAVLHTCVGVILAQPTGEKKRQQPGISQECKLERISFVFMHLPCPAHTQRVLKLRKAFPVQKTLAAD